MNCLKCKTEMVYAEGEDEFGTNELIWYAVYTCPSCDFIVRDFEDAFIFPKEEEEGK